MTRPERIAVLRERLGEVERAVGEFRAALVETNDEAHQAFFGDLLARIARIVANERAGVTMELAGDLQKARHDLRRIALPERDPVYDAPTAALRALRGVRGNLVEALENALDAALEVGLSPRLSEFGELKVPRDAVAVQLARLDERLRAVQTAVEELSTTAGKADAAPVRGVNGPVSQRGVVNLHVAALSVEIDAARFETRSSASPGVPAETDLAALARSAEAVRDIARDLRATVEGLRDWVAPAVSAAGQLVARFADRSWRGVRTVVSFVRRHFLRRGEVAEAPAPRDGAPPDFDMAKVQEMILAGQAPPDDWVPWITDLHFTGDPRWVRNLMGSRVLPGFEKLADLAPLAGLANLQSLDLDNTEVTDLAPLAGLVNLISIRINNKQVADLAPLAGLAKLRWLYVDDTQVADLAPLARLTNLQWLSLDNTRVADLVPLAGLANLQRLRLNSTRVADLAPLAGLANLHWLSLDNTQVADLAPLARLTNLQWLSLDNTRVADLVPLAGLANLQRLRLNSTRVADLAPLAGLANLHWLSLDNTQVADLAPLSGLGNLQRLSLDNTRVADLAPLAGLADLEVSISDRVVRPAQLVREGNSLLVRDITTEHAASRGRPRSRP